MGRFGAPDDLIGATLFLASDLARFVTGIMLPVDGGFSAFSGV
jgi:NAD(P)-dependent dehydrogenase (short-subunit alcohol dehydrogenase family)